MRSPSDTSFQDPHSLKVFVVKKSSVGTSPNHGLFKLLRFGLVVLLKQGWLTPPRQVDDNAENAGVLDGTNMKV